MSFGFGFGFTKITAAIRAAFSPSSLFAANEPGVWYDPSDLSTLYQDAAGTTPVTAVGQPVGLILDKSGNGNHAYQTTATSRPVLSARYNLLTKTEQFDDAAWVKNGATVTANAAVAPDGTVTADRVTTSATDGLVYLPTYANSYPQPITFSVCAKADASSSLTIQFTSSGNGRGATFDLNAGTCTAVVAIGTGTGVSGGVSSIAALGGNWYRCTISNISVTDLRFPVFNVVGPSNSSIYIWGASLVPANQASLPYQRVNTATDYDTAGFPHYLRFDGVDDWLVTPTITPGIDKVQVFAGVRRLTDTAGVICELSVNWNNSAGSFLLWGGNNVGGVGAGFNSASRGSKGASGAHFGFTQSVFTPPITAVVSAIHDINGDHTSVRGNGIEGTNGTGDKGTGNFLDYPLYIGRRGGTSLPFNGHIYSLIVRFGSNLPIETIEKTEKYINTKTRAY